MPNVGRKPGGGFKPSSKNKGASRKVAINQSLSQRGTRPSRRKQGFDDDDLPLSPDEAVVEEETGEGRRLEQSVAEPFSDGLVSRQFKGLAIVPRVGGEECSLLADFLSVFARTEPFIGAISQKASYMKKQGGRLL